MALNIHLPENTVMKPEITVFGVGGAGGNATNNMIKENLEGVNFVVANTDAQALDSSLSQKRIQLGQETTKGLGAGASPAVGAASAEEAMDEIIEHLSGSNMVFITAGMGGGTGTGAAPVIARAARELGILTVGVVTKPFHFEGPRRMKLAEDGLEELQKHVDTLIVIPNQNLFRIANEKTTFADAFKLADNVLHRGVRGVTDLMIMPGLINLDFADVKAVMGEMGKAMMGTGEAEGERRAQDAAEAAISNPLLDNVSMKGARGVLINITGGMDMTLFEVDEAANRIREEVDASANIIFGSTFSESLDGKIRVSVVATGIDAQSMPYTSSVVKNVVKTEAPVAIKEAEAESGVEDLFKKSDDSLDEDEVDEVASEAEDEEADYDEEDQESEYDYDNVQEAIKEEFMPSNVDEEYFEAIKNLNDEYKAKLESEAAKHAVPDDGLFVPPAPVQPSNYDQSDLGVASSSEEADDVATRNVSGESAKSGGLFSRMAKAARGLHGQESVPQEPIQQSEKTSTKEPSDEDLMDIPAFLRRKA